MKSKLVIILILALSVVFSAPNVYASKKDALASATIGENIKGGFGDFYIQSRNNFTRNNNEIIWFGNFKGFMTAYKANLTAHWITPAGQTFKEEKFTTKYGNANFGWAKLDIKGSDSAALDLEGEWTVKIYWDEELIDSRSFTIGAAAFAKTPLAQPAHIAAPSAESAEGHMRLAKAYFSNNDFNNTVRSLQRAQSIEPENPKPYLLLGTVYLAMNNAQNAMLQLTKAEQLGADAVSVKRALAQTYVKLNLPDQAIEEYKKLLAIQPNSKIDKDALKKLELQRKS